VRFQVLTEVSIKIRAFWDVGRCSLAVDRRFRGAYCLRHQGTIHRPYLWNVGFVSYTTRLYISEGNSPLATARAWNLIFPTFKERHHIFTINICQLIIFWVKQRLHWGKNKTHSTVQ
jgi:hypothetical protein